MPRTSACERRSSTVPRAPREVLGDLPALRLERLGERDEPLGRVRPPVEHHVLDPLAQLRRNLVVDAELAGVDDAHRHAGPDRVVEEHCVDRLAHRVVAAEREAHVRHAARHLGVRQVLADPARRVDEIDRVVVVLLDAGGDREDVRIEHDVLGREVDLLRVRSVVARAAQMSTLRSNVSAWPFSSKAITMAAAP